MLDEDEIIGINGLARCTNCGTLREMILDVGGRTYRTRVRCRCQAEQDDQARSERRRREELDKISRLRTAPLQNRRLAEYIFANDNGSNPKMEIAQRYLAKWLEMERRGQGLVLFGGTGTGKTYMAGCIVNALLEQGIPALMTTMPQILTEIAAAEWEEKQQVILGLNRYRLLVLDDLGIERKTDYVLEQMFGVIDSRSQTGLPMIVTTNLTLEQLRNPGSLPLQRIYDRILERCTPVLVNECNIRGINTKQNMENTRMVLL